MKLKGGTSIQRIGEVIDIVEAIQCPEISAVGCTVARATVFPYRLQMAPRNNAARIRL